MATDDTWQSDGLRFSCTQCGNCCTGPSGFVWFTDGECAKMAASFGMTPAEFCQQYAHRTQGRWTLNEQLTEHGYDCTFLRRDAEGKALCSIYKIRPRQCRTWPFWPENLGDEAAWDSAARTCPGINHGKLYPVDQVRIIRDSNHFT